VGNLLVGAIIGFASAFLLRSWQYRRDVWLKRVEGLCAVLDLAAQSGTEYWIAGRAEQGNGVHKDSSSEAKSDQTEARIIGLQGRVDGMFASLELDETNDEDLQRLLSDFRDSLTGGCFGGATRDSDPDRARLVQMYASDLIVAVWASAYSHLSYLSLMRRRAQDATWACNWLAAKLSAWQSDRK
jgi:hypothetical protein